jgi:signal transduction histidine kinase
MPEGGGEMAAAAASGRVAAPDGAIRRHQLAVSRLALLNEAADAMQGAAGRGDRRSLHETILVAATAGEGLRFQRAFLLLVDEPAAMLRGAAGIGPADPDEARRVWDELERLDLDLRGILEHYRRSGAGGGSAVDRLARSLEIPLRTTDHLLIRPLFERRALRAGPGAPAGPVPAELAERLATDALAAAPLLGGARCLGVLAADHAITKAPITDEDLELLRLFAGYAGAALEDARLHAELGRKIEELRRAHEVLRSHQERIVEMEKLSAIGEVAARVAHEIRTPLVTIGGFANQVARSLPEGSADRAALRVVREEVLRLERIVTDMLDFVRPPSRDLAPGDLSEAADRAVRLLGDELRARGVVVTARLGRDLPAVRMNPHQIHQVFENLFRNAADAMPDGGNVLLTTDAADGRVRAHVEDEGPGIPEEFRDKVFRPFFSTKQTGSGLGLAIALQIVEAHHGRLRFRPREGGGTRFTVELPEDREERRA